MTANGRERNKQATRRALRAATLDLGLQRGLADVPIEDIATRAGVSTRTFFNYFDTKEDAALIELFLMSDDELAALAGGGASGGGASGGGASGGGASGVWADLCRLFVADVQQAEGADLPRYLQLHAQHPALHARQMGRFALALGRVGDAVTARLGPAHRLRAEVMAGSCVTAVRVGLGRWSSDGARGTAAPHVAAAFAEFDGAFGPSA